MTKAVFGKPITAEDVESLPADTGPTAFVRLCGVLIGKALAERFGHSAVPRITERIAVPDGGVDAEYTSPPIEQIAEAYGLIGPGRTVFQFKYRDVRARGRAAAARGLLSQLRKDFVRDVPACDRFVLMTNLQLDGTQPSRLRSQLERVAGLAGKPIVLWGAAEIALRINQSPHLRHLLSPSGGFCTLDVAEEELQASYATVGWPPFVGRQQERTTVEEFINDPRARVMQVVGPRYVGKTRLVIEALRSHGASALWSSRPEDLSVDDFRDLDASEEPTILVVDRCERASTQRLLEDTAARRRLKTIVVRTGSASETGPGRLGVAPFDYEETGKLVTALLPKASWPERSWLRQATEGLPGVVVHVAALIKEARVSPAAPADEIRRRIDELVEEKYLLPLDTDARRALSVAALLTVLGVEGEPGKETDAISQALELEPEQFSAHVRDLERVGLIRRRGRFIEVTPPRLAERLASEALRKPEAILAELRVSLDQGAFRRFLERFRDLPKARGAIEQVLSAGGWFNDLQSLISGAEELQILAPAAPSAALRCLERLLAPLQASDLRTIEGDAGRSIVSTLGRLALRSATFVGSARLVLALAEAENENWSTDAADVFLELFHWQHPEVAAPYGHRLAVLREGAVADSARKRTLAARACGTAFGELVVDLHHAEGGDLPERPYRPETRDDVRQYAASILDLLTGLRRDPDPDPRRAAFGALVASLDPFVRYSLTAKGLDELGRRAFVAIEELGRSVPDVGHREQVVTEVELLVEHLSEIPDPSGARDDALESGNTILKGLTEGNLRDRLWRWAGPPSWKLQTLSAEDSPEIGKSVDGLARDLVLQPSAFDEHLSWLTGPDAERRAALFLALGRQDRDRRLLASLLRAQDGPEWPQAFSAYVAGWAAGARPEAEALLDELAASRSNLATGILRATASLSPSPSNVRRILDVMRSGSLSRQEAIREISSLRWEDLTEAEFERLVRALDDGSPEVRASLLWPLLRRLARDAPLTPGTRELAWAFLHSTATAPGGRHGHDWDFLAARLGKSELDRLLGLMESLIGLPPAAGQSLTLRGQLPLVWQTLETRDRPGLVRLLLRTEMASNAPSWVKWELEGIPRVSGEGSLAGVRHGLLRPAEDRELLLDFAREHGVEAARAIAGVLDAGKDGFWPVARGLLSEWRDDEVVRGRLWEQVGSGAYAGSAGPMVTERLEAARRLLADPDTKVANWARDVVEFLEDWRRRAERDDREEWIWDYRIRPAELERMLRSPDSPQRLWAIGRLLKDAPVKRVLQLLTFEEILEALPRLTEIDEATRQKWTAYAKDRLEP